MADFDKAAHEMMQFRAGKYAEFESGRFLVAYHEDRLYSVRDKKRGTVTLVEAKNPESAYLKASSIRPDDRKTGRSPNPTFVPPPTKRKRRYFRKCGVCGERWEQSDMIRTDNSPNGWICHECVLREHPEYEIEDW